MKDMKALARYLVKNANALNMALLVVLIVLAGGIATYLVRMRHDYPLPRVKAKAVSQEPAPAEPPPAGLPSDYALIGEMNLFHPDRVIPVDRKAEVPRPEVVLYGTMLEDGVRFALIEDKRSPRSTPGRGNRQSTVRKGEVVSGYTVTQITSDSIELARGDDRMTVPLTSPEKRKEVAPTAAPRQPETQVKPVQAAPPGGTRPAQAAPPAPPGASRNQQVPVGETLRPGGTQGAAPPARPQPFLPRSTPE